MTLDWELPYTTGVALKRKLKKKRKPNRSSKTNNTLHCFEQRKKKKEKKRNNGSSLRGATETNPTRIHEDVGLIPGLTQWVGDLVLLWLCSSDSTPSLGISICYRCGPKKARKKKRKKKDRMPSPFSLLNTAGISFPVAVRCA